MKDITPTVYDGLSKKEKELLYSLGLSPSKKKRKSPKYNTRATTRKPYILVVTSKCRLCGEQNQSVYHMEKDGDQLISKELPSLADAENWLRVQTTSYTTRSCLYCRAYLSSLEHDKLVDLMISYINDPRNFM